MTVPHTPPSPPAALDLLGRTALVTGAAGGIGRACALRLAAAGATVRAVDRDSGGLDTLTALAATLPGTVEPVLLDLRDLDAAEETAAGTDILVAALEGAAHGVTSNCVNPAYVRTPLVERQIADQAAAHGIPADRVVSEITLADSAVKRLIEPEEVAEAVAYLCGPPASFITGASLALDGGWTAH